MAGKKVYRSRKDKMIGGVCAGIAEYFNIDPIIVRLAAILLFFVNGTGFLVYIISWIIIPEEPSSTGRYNYNYSSSSNTIDVDGYSSSDSDGTSNKEGKDSSDSSGFDTEYDSKDKTRSRKGTEFNNGNRGDRSQRIIGIILIGLGALFLIDNLLPYFYWQRFWPVVIVGFGIVLLLKGVNDNE